ncbi:NUDIX domain-containing protein [Planosporangium flavigriseum]|uniref:Putative hydrolase MutT/NUDIX n=1 Tax=Planosporangium flavigriseum TaxID=373681 RepID=A0A8J3PKQ0_9ACTN|nr:NUDIX hydrolase [Planosporangium flavigriseum]NJC64170.1 NUDIX domain-containing protein [Planosporangium flavigriseum]GIG73052.1 putative hydrolase MutT/NUDIX [Planosporangium flavigriseum]
MTRVVRAAGGVVARDGAAGKEVVLVHRPRYDDWSLPKGKLEPGEHPLLGAVREVGEETSVRAAPRLRLPSTHYLTGNPDVEKSVDYWSMVCLQAAEFVPNDEVDEVRWVPVSQAAKLLTYAHDRGVLAAYPPLSRVDGLVMLLRHAYAGEREEWEGDDDDRPLDDGGRATARALAPLLAVYGPTRIISAGRSRCVQTVEPLAAMTGLPIEVDDRFDESADAKSAAGLIRELAASDGVIVVCSQGGLIPGVVGTISGRDPGSYRTPKGSGWVLGFAGTEFVAADRFDLEPLSM